MAPVARELASNRGVLEPFQTESSIDGQVEELRAVLEKNGSLPVELIGFSWGAWLSFIAAARYPAVIKKLILVSSGPFEEKYSERIIEARLARLDELEKAKVHALIEALESPSNEARNSAFSQLGILFSKADAFNPMDCESEVIDCQADIFQSVWKEAVEWRRSGKLLELGKKIQCPVAAIHGDYDPHPAEGVKEPLASVLKDFRFILLRDCGHKPWIERKARVEFFRILKEELR